MLAISARQRGRRCTVLFFLFSALRSFIYLTRVLGFVFFLFPANREVGQIRYVTSRLLETGLKPDKGQSAPFVLNKANPFGSTNSTKVLSLGV